MSAFFVSARAWKARTRQCAFRFLVSLGLSVPALAGAAEAGPTLRQAIEAALMRNPDLAMFQFDLRINDAQREQAALRPPMELGGSLENFAGTKEFNALDEAEATVTLFPYRPELDQSGALLRALGSGAAVAAYDVGGIADPVKRYGAGLVASADDVAALAEGVGRLLDDADALALAREGALVARQELTWDRAALAHLALYEELLA